MNMIIKTEFGIYTVIHVEIVALKQPTIKFTCPERVKFTKKFNTMKEAKEVLNEIYDNFKKQPMELDNTWEHGINY